MRINKIEYINAYAKFVDKNTVEYELNGEKKTKTAKYIVVATGLRPSLPNIEGKEYAYTSDDIFSLPQEPGKTLVIGASYIALECAGYIKGLGYDVTVAVRSILLRGFDQGVAKKIEEYMVGKGINFQFGKEPQKIVKKEDGKYGVYFGDEESIYDTVLMAVGRSPLNDINLNKIGVNLSDNGKIITDENDRTNIENIYAIGDISFGKPELTPVAIKSGKLLAARMFNNGKTIMDYTNVPTTVFTPIEYGSCGLSEEKAYEKYGKENIVIYHTAFTPLEWNLPHYPDSGYVKLITLKNENYRVIGYHVLSPNAGEITQGISVAMKANATKSDFDRAVGIHPTCAEEMTTLETTMEDDPNPVKSGC